MMPPLLLANKGLASNRGSFFVATEGKSYITLYSAFRRAAWLAGSSRNVLLAHVFVELEVMGGCSDAGDIRFAVAGEVSDNAISGGDSPVVQHRILPSLAA